MTQVAKFISFEGTEGVGKTTVMHSVCQYLNQQGIEYVRTREPGGSQFAEWLRTMLLNPSTDINADTELLLMFTARADHLDSVILPALEQGKWVICDRFVDSSFAYQGYGRGHANPQMMTKIQNLTNDFVTRMPDSTIWLDLPILDGLQRAKNRSTEDRFEQEKSIFFERVYQGYLELSRIYPRRFKRVSALGTQDEVFKKVCSVLEV